MTVSNSEEGFLQQLLATVSPVLNTRMTANANLELYSRFWAQCKIHQGIFVFNHSSKIRVNLNLAKSLHSLWDISYLLRNNCVVRFEFIEQFNKYILQSRHDFNVLSDTGYKQISFFLAGLYVENFKSPSQQLIDFVSPNSQFTTYYVSQL